METFIFDGTLEGILASVFYCYQRKSGTVKLVNKDYYLPDVLQKNFLVVSDEEKGRRVWAGLKKKLDKEWLLRFYKAYLSEQPEAYQHLFNFARYMIDNPSGA